MLLAALLAACGQEPAEGPSGPRIELVESIRGDRARSVRLSAAISPGEREGERELDAVRVILTPATATSTRKLEALLDDLTLSVRGDGWPTSAREMPREAEPATSRFELAIAGLEPSLEGRFDRFSLSLFDGPFAAGLTRVELAAGTMSVDTLSLAAADASAAVAWGHAGGPRSAEGFRLEGAREFRIASGGQPRNVVEAITLEARRTKADAPAPIPP